MSRNENMVLKIGGKHEGENGERYDLLEKMKVLFLAEGDPFAKDEAVRLFVGFFDSMDGQDFLKEFYSLPENHDHDQDTRKDVSEYSDIQLALIEYIQNEYYLITADDQHADKPVNFESIADRMHFHDAVARGELYRKAFFALVDLKIISIQQV